MDDTLVLIPAYRPTDNLIELANSLYTVGFRIVIVDDGSGEEYAGVFDKAEAYATVIGYEESRGRGFALRYGMDFIIKEMPYFKYLITVDTDDGYSEEAVRTVSTEIRRTGGIVMGRRNAENSPSTLFELTSNAIVRGIYALLTGLYIDDIRSGLRAFEFRYIKRLSKLGGNGFDYDVTVLIDAAKRRIPVTVVNVEENVRELRLSVKSDYHLEDFFMQVVTVIKGGYPSIVSQLANLIFIILFTAIFGGSLASCVSAVMLGGYVGMALSVYLNNKIGCERNSDGILSYNRLITGMLRMFVYTILMVILHNMIGLQVSVSLAATVIVTAIIEIKIMRRGLDSDLRVRPVA